MIPIDLSGRVSIVTGAASGIGRAISLRLADAGSSVVIADVSSTGEEVASSLSNAGHPAVFIKTDVADLASVRAMVDTAIRRFNRIDILVNNAGILSPRLLVDPAGREEITEEIWNAITSINQKGAFFCAQAVARVMIPARSGVIVNISSESGLEGSHGQSVYAATKAALYSCTRSWAKELGRYGIRVVGVAPGILEQTGLRTAEYERALAYTRGITVEELRAGYEHAAIPLGRVGRLEEVANAVCFLASDLASYITGTVLNVSGGKSRA